VILKTYGEIVQTNNLGVKQYVITDSANMIVVMENMEDRSEERSASIYLYEGTIPFTSDVLFFKQWQFLCSKLAKSSNHIAVNKEHFVMTDVKAFLSCSAML
jgi:hypothetical protein